MNKKQKILFRTINENLNLDSLEFAENAAQILFNQKNISILTKRKIKKSFLKISKIYLKKNQFYNALIDYEHCRALTPGDSKLLENEFLIFNKFFNQCSKDFVYIDFILFEAILILLISPYKKKNLNFYRPSIQIEIDLRKKINELLPNAPKKAESVYTFKIEQILLNLDKNLSVDERLEKASKILAPHILEIIKEKLTKDKNKQDSKKD